MTTAEILASIAQVSLGLAALAGVFLSWMQARRAASQSYKNGEVLDHVHLLVNSRFTELLKLQKAASFQEGMAAEHAADIVRRQTPTGV